MNDKFVVILGPTASGKSDLAVKLAKKFDGEIISADSRQVYKGLDVGSGKITKKEMREVSHHLLDIASPKRKFTVAQYQKLALKKIRDIQRRGKLPFLVGGTGFYIQSIVDNLIIPEVKPNWKLRKTLAKKPANELFLILKKLDPARAKSIDSQNPRRLIRAVEIAQYAKHRGTNAERRRKKIPHSSAFVLRGSAILQIGIRKSQEVPKSVLRRTGIPVVKDDLGKLKKAIQKRLLKRLQLGMVKEAEKLHQQGLSWKRLEELGLEYRYVAQYLQGKLNHQEMKDKIQKESERLAKRQMTWFKRDKRIHWIENYKAAEKLIRSFLSAS